MNYNYESVKMFVDAGIPKGLLKKNWQKYAISVQLIVNVIKIKTAQSARQLPQVSEKVYFCGSSPFCA